MSREELTLIIEKVVFSTFNDLKDKKPTKKYEDILIPNLFSKEELIKQHYIKNIQMKLGSIWPLLISSFSDWEDLGVGDNSGLDLINREKKIIVEIKNRFNTDNASSRKTNYDKLSNFYVDTGYLPIYGIINCKTVDGIDKIITHNGINIRYLSGKKLLKFFLGDSYRDIVNITSHTIMEILNESFGG
jgi:hypothetical protein